MNKIVMLVDDDVIFNWVSSKMIEKLGANLTINSYLNGKIALDVLLEHYKEDNFYYILLDINMPELNGWGFLEALEKEAAIKKENISIYMVSSSTDASDIKKAESYALVKGYFSKPLSPEMINSILEP